ncbi:hybrid signal transduction histidine kinase M [Tanacetum coccineum]
MNDSEDVEAQEVPAPMGRDRPKKKGSSSGARSETSIAGDPSLVDALLSKFTMAATPFFTQKKESSSEYLRIKERELELEERKRQKQGELKRVRIAQSEKELDLQQKMFEYQQQQKFEEDLSISWEKVEEAHTSRSELGRSSEKQKNISLGLLVAIMAVYAMEHWVMTRKVIIFRVALNFAKLLCFYLLPCILKPEWLNWYGFVIVWIIATANTCSEELKTMFTWCYEKGVLVIKYVIDTVLKPIRKDQVSPPSDPPLADNIFLTLSDTLQECLAVADPQIAKEVWDHIATIFHDNKRTRTIALNGELLMIKHGDLTVDAYFCKIKSISTILTSFGSSTSNDDMVTYALQGLSENFDHVAGIIAYWEPLLDLTTVCSMITTEEMRLKAKSQAPVIGSSSSSPMVLLVESANNRRENGRNNRTSQRFF